jgi:hypothetical protein
MSKDPLLARAIFVTAFIAAVVILVFAGLIIIPVAIIGGVASGIYKYARRRLQRGPASVADPQWGRPVKDRSASAQERCPRTAEPN